MGWDPSAEKDDSKDGNRAKISLDGKYSFDFGSVIGSPGLELTHEYALTNKTKKKITVIRSINGKPCCGNVAPIPKIILDSGQTVKLAVTLRIGKTTGPIQHKAMIETDDRNNPILEFWTHALVHPRSRIEEDGEGENRSKMPAEMKALTKRFKAYSYGTRQQPPPELNDLRAKNKINAVWEGAPQTRTLDGGIIQHSRSFNVLMESEGKPGPRSSEISLYDNGILLQVYPVQWELASALKASPNGLYIEEKKGKIERRILIRSNDDRPFTIQEIGASFPGIRAEAAAKTPNKLQTITLKIEPSESNRGIGGEINIQTTHPNQKEIRVPIFIINDET